MQCLQCQHENRLGAKFCEECAAPLVRTCSSCGAQLSRTAKFCSECAHPAAPPVGACRPEREARPFCSVSAERAGFAREVRSTEPPSKMDAQEGGDLERLHVALGVVALADHEAAVARLDRRRRDDGIDAGRRAPPTRIASAPALIVAITRTFFAPLQRTQLGWRNASRTDRLPTGRRRLRPIT